MHLLLLTAILALSIVLCKGIALAVVLCFATIKNRKFQRDSERWDHWFSSLSQRKLTLLAVCWYLLAVSAASIITYFILHACRFEHALSITVLFFLVRCILSLFRYRKNKDALLTKMKRDLS